MGSEIVSSIIPASEKSIINKNVHNELLAAPDDNHPLSNEKSLKEFTEIMLLRTK